MTLADQLRVFSDARALPIDLQGDTWAEVVSNAEETLRNLTVALPYPVVTPKDRQAILKFMRLTKQLRNNLVAAQVQRGVSEYDASYYGVQEIRRAWQRKILALTNIDYLKWATVEREDAIRVVCGYWKMRRDFIVKQVAYKADYAFWVKVYAKPWPGSGAHNAMTDLTQEFLAIAGNQAQKSRKGGGSMLFYVPDYLPDAPGDYLMRYVIEPVIFAGDEKIAYTYEV